MKGPTLSVVMPAYNAEKWLEAAVRSVLEQSYSDLELIIVNDGSKDATGALAKSFVDPRVRVIDQVNGGVSKARNAGMEQARGTFIAFMDADDVMYPDNLRAKMDALMDNPVEWVFSDMQRCDEQMEPTGEVDKGTDGDVVRTILSGRGIGVPGFSSNVIMHRKCFDAGARFDPGLSNSADQDMALTLAKDFPYLHLPEVLFGYRVLQGSMSKNITVFEHDHLYLLQKAERNGLMSDDKDRCTYWANAYWTIGGSWWKNAGKPGKAIPYFLKAVFKRPALLLRPFTRV